MEESDKRKMYTMDPILEDTIYRLMSKYNLEQYEGAKNIFNGFIKSNKNICSQFKVESYKAQFSKTLTCFTFFCDKFLKQAGF